MRKRANEWTPCKIATFSSFTKATWLLRDKHLPTKMSPIPINLRRTNAPRMRVTLHHQIYSRALYFSSRLQHRIAIRYLTSISTFSLFPKISIYSMCNNVLSRSQWPHGLRSRSAAARLLRLWVRIPPGAWMCVGFEFWVMSGRGLRDELITPTEESYRVWCCWVRSRVVDNREALAQWGLLCHGKKNIYIYVMFDAYLGHWRLLHQKQTKIFYCINIVYIYLYIWHFYYGIIIQFMHLLYTSHIPNNFIFGR